MALASKPFWNVNSINRIRLFNGLPFNFIIFGTNLGLKFEFQSMNFVYESIHSVTEFRSLEATCFRTNQNLMINK